MGATAHLKAVSQDVVEIFRAHPQLIEPFLCGLPPSLPPGIPAEMKEQILKSLHDPKRLHWLTQDISGICPEHLEVILAEACEPDLNLDKAWQELVPCITGDGPQHSPLGRCITGGMPLGRTLGYGPARILDHLEVLETSVALESVDAEVFKTRAQGLGLSTKSANSLLTIFEALRQYYRQAANGKKGMLLSMA